MFGCFVFFLFFFICGLWLLSKKKRQRKDLEEELGIVRQELGALELLLNAPPAVQVDGEVSEDEGFLSGDD